MHDSGTDGWPSLIPTKISEVGGPYTIQISIAYTLCDSYQRFGVIFSVEKFDTSDEAENFKARFEEFLQEWIIGHRQNKAVKWHIWVVRPMQIFSSTPCSFMTTLRLALAKSSKTPITQSNNFNAMLKQMIQKLQEVSQKIK
jgi:hypothetical protein